MEQGGSKEIKIRGRGMRKSKRVARRDRVISAASE